MSFKYGAYIKHPIYYTRKGEVKMKNEFKAGEIIYLIDRIGCVRLAEFTSKYGSKTVEAVDATTDDSYLGVGFAVTRENREALVTLYGEDAVPELPLRGSELTKRLLEKQKYVLCWISAYSDDTARINKVLAAIQYIDDNSNLFTCVDGYSFCHAVPVDMNGNEITEIE